ncbi:hypothetical protein BGZ80_008064, partial [Entomortierella chlamydospora]
AVQAHLPKHKRKKRSKGARKRGRRGKKKRCKATKAAAIDSTPPNYYNLSVNQKAVYQPTFKFRRWLERKKSSTMVDSEPRGDDQPAVPHQQTTIGSDTEQATALRDAAGAAGTVASGAADAVVHSTSEAAGAAGSAAKSAAHGVGSVAAGATGAVVNTAEHAARGVGHVAEAVAIGTGAVVIGGGLLAAGALHKVDGVWKRIVQVLTTRKAHVDKVCPIAKTSYVYYDDDVYDAVLTEKNTGVTYVTQLIYDTETKVYYVYYRFGETDYKLDGPHKTIEAAKDAFQLTYKEKFAVEWTERETAVSDRYIYETKTYETFEEVEEVEEVVDENKAQEIISEQERSIWNSPTIKSIGDVESTMPPLRGPGA